MKNIVTNSYNKYLLKKMNQEKISFKSMDLFDRGRRSIIENSINRYLEIFDTSKEYLKDMGFSTVVENFQLKFNSLKDYTDSTKPFSHRWEWLMDSRIEKGKK